MVKVFIDEVVASYLEQWGMVSDGVMVCKSVFQTNSPRLFPKRGIYKFAFFNSDIVTFLLKANGRRGRSPNFIVVGG